MCLSSFIILPIVHFLGIKFLSFTARNEAYVIVHSLRRLEKAESSETDLAVRAAAASIYSTCNFLSSMENLPCC